MLLQAQIFYQPQVGDADLFTSAGDRNQSQDTDKAKERKPISPTFYAFNEICLKPSNTNRLVSTLMEIEVNREILDQYHGDGVLVSTPTGSTSYTVAANGPIISPDLDVITITPICPLSLSSRPIVISGSATVEIWPLADPEGLTRVWADGTLAQAVNPGQLVEVQRSPHTVNLIILDREQSYFRTLREKLQWAGSRIYIPTTNHRADWS